MMRRPVLALAFCPAPASSVRTAQAEIRLAVPAAFMDDTFVKNLAASRVLAAPA